MTYNYNRYGKPHEELHLFCSLLVEHKSRLNERTCVETPEEADHFLQDFGFKRGRESKGSKLPHSSHLGMVSVKRGRVG